MYALLRPLLFQLKAETAHNITLSGLKLAHRCHLHRPKQFNHPTTLAGLELANPIGLAAGLDKNGDYIDALAALGFGFIEIGTVTPRPQPGNPKPRLFRLQKDQAIINRMGFNNKGVDALIENVKRANYNGVLGINLGKNADTPLAEAHLDYCLGIEKAFLHASYLTINISSPNTQNLRDLQEGDAFKRLLDSIKETHTRLAQQHQKNIPLFVKIAPDLDQTAVNELAHQLLQYDIDGVIATNTTFSREGLSNSHLANERGGLSGAPLTQQSNRITEWLAQALQGRLPIIGAGGTMTGQDATRKLSLGAQAVQLYSGLVYQGPQLIQDCIRHLQERS